MKRGLTLGKFPPLHRGHRLVIQTALEEMDEVVVIVYDAPGTTRVPLAVRAGWIRAVYPAARVIEAGDGPTAVGYTPEIMRSHERYVIDRLGVSGENSCCSSEPCAEYTGRELDADDRVPTASAHDARHRRPCASLQRRLPSGRNG